jgi:hypothetical protein
LVVWCSMLLWWCGLRFEMWCPWNDVCSHVYAGLHWNCKPDEIFRRRHLRCRCVCKSLSQLWCIFKSFQLLSNECNDFWEDESKIFFQLYFWFAFILISHLLFYIFDGFVVKNNNVITDFFWGRLHQRHLALIVDTQNFKDTHIHLQPIFYNFVWYFWLIHHLR